MRVFLDVFEACCWGLRTSGELARQSHPESCPESFIMFVIVCDMHCAVMCCVATAGWPSQQQVLLPSPSAVVVQLWALVPLVLLLVHHMHSPSSLSSLSG